MNRIVEVLPDQSALVRRACEIVVETIDHAIAARGLCTLALAGGGTPKPLYELLATQNLPWSAIHIFWGDERYVPADHPDSNQRMARLAWLDQVPIPAKNIDSIATDATDPVMAASHHEAELREFFQLQSGEVPVFDVVLLGIGDDGHTASLFPHTPALAVNDRLVTVGNKDGQPRLTFTVPLINQARVVLFLVAGASKNHALTNILAPTGDAMTYPARLIQPEGTLWWLLDAAAGQNIENP
jgi:6-phosphogluconolactonase